MKLLVCGVALLALSGKPLVLMGRELAIGLSVNARYSVELITRPERGMAGGAVRASIGPHVVALEDDLPVQDGGPDIRVDGRVRIVVDERDYSHPAPASIRLGQIWPAKQ